MRRPSMHVATLVPLAALVAAMASCNVNEYPLCVGCPDAAVIPDTGVIIDTNPPHDGQIIDAALIDATDTDASTCPTGDRELCDGVDNDCDRVIDEAPVTGTGTACSTNVGQCVAGIYVCVAGEIQCSGVLPAPDEDCDGLDNDCDGTIDEDIASGGTCGLTDTGECALGELRCSSGAVRCVGAVYPTIEQCDSLDQDCDGNPLNGFNLSSDSQNCGACGNVCRVNNAVARCNGAGSCEIAVCSPSYWNLNNTYADGCEYGPCAFQSPLEGCNQADDDCDGRTDENLEPPDICLTVGACGDPAPMQPVCTAAGWRCEYGPDVEVDATGNIVPETLCDSIDNDCDGVVDEGHPLVGTECNDGQNGICRSTGTYVCDAANPGGPAICAIDSPGATPTTERCNNLDDDCDTNIDEGDVRSWVNIGRNVEMFAHEASRPDATATSTGTVNLRPCSHAGALPWTNITQPAAQAACASIGARLCAEFEWQRACQVLAPAATPVAQGPSPNYLVFIEAEEFVTHTAANGRSWVMDTSNGYSGSAALRVLPNTGTRLETGSIANSPRLDYSVNFRRTGTHYVWIRGWGANTNDDSVHVGLNGAAVASADKIDGFTDAWGWSHDTVDGPVATINVPSTGVHTLNVWMREDGFRLDAILLTQASGYVPTQVAPNGCGWSYGANCTSYADTTCNGLDYDADPATPGDQDEIEPTGSLAACYADWGGANRIHDMSGNVREWTAARLPGVNPLRGGTATSTANGTSCDYSFTVADDDFFFPNVGFRCCR